MKVPCIHGSFDAHEFGGEWQCIHGPGVAHIVDCGTYRMVGGQRCNGGETPTDEQLITELRKRGTLILDDRGNTDRLVTRWSGYHQDKT